MTPSRTPVSCLIVCLMIHSGCKRDSDSTPSPGPSTRAAQILEPATLDIEGLIVHFPPVHLRTQSTGSGMTIDLTTPADADGDRIDLTMTLDDTDDVANLPGAAWHFHTDDPDRGDTLNRISLKEPLSVLEPMDLQITFGQEGDRITVQIDGQFRWYDPPDAEKPARVVSVTGKQIGRAHV